MVGRGFFNGPIVNMYLNLTSDDHITTSKYLGIEAAAVLHHLQAWTNLASALNNYDRPRTTIDLALWIINAECLD